MSSFPFMSTLTGTAGGAVLGVNMGKVFAKDPENRTPSMIRGGLIGALAGGGLGYYVLPRLMMDEADAARYHVGSTRQVMAREALKGAMSGSAVGMAAGGPALMLVGAGVGAPVGALKCYAGIKYMTRTGKLKNTGGDMNINALQFPAMEALSAKITGAVKPDKRGSSEGMFGSGASSLRPFITKRTGSDKLSAAWWQITNPLLSGAVVGGTLGALGGGAYTLRKGEAEREGEGTSTQRLADALKGALPGAAAGILAGGAVGPRLAGVKLPAALRRVLLPGAAIAAGGYGAYNAAKDIYNYFTYSPDPEWYQTLPGITALGAGAGAAMGATGGAYALGGIGTAIGAVTGGVGGAVLANKAYPSIARAAGLEYGPVEDWHLPRRRREFGF